MAERFCVHCGKPSQAESRFCPHCGKTQTVSPEVFPRRLKVIFSAVGGSALLLIVIVLAVVLMRGNRSPESVFEAMKAAILKDDPGTVFDLMSPRFQDSFKEVLTEVKKRTKDDPEMKKDNIESMSARDYFIYTVKKENALPPKDAVKEATIEKVTRHGDDHATLVAKFPNGTKTFRMVRIEGHWYLEEPPE